MGFTMEQGGGAQAGLSVGRDDIDTLTLAQRVEGHFLASMAVLSAAHDNREKLLNEFYAFFKNSAEKPDFKYKTIIIKGTADAASMASVKHLLESNQIRYAAPRVTGKNIVAYDYRTDSEGTSPLRRMISS